jgi:hypothetical protein
MLNLDSPPSLHLLSIAFITIICALQLLTKNGSAYRYDTIQRTEQWFIVACHSAILIGMRRNYDPQTKPVGVLVLARMLARNDERIRAGFDDGNGRAAVVE